MDIFGTSRPNQSAVGKWRLGWKDKRERIKVNSFNSTIKFLEANNIDPLLYQFYAEPGEDKLFYVVFYENEHEVFFKLHSGIT